MEVGLLNATLFKSDIASKRGAQSVNDRALHLLLDTRRVNRLSTVDGAYDAVDPDLALHNRYLGNLCIKASKAVDHRDAHRTSCRQGFPPACFFCREVQRAKKPRLVREKDPAKLHGILSCSEGKLVDEAFGEECILRMPHRAPVVGGYLDSWLAIFHLDVRDVIENVCDSRNAFAVDAVLHSG